MSAVRRTSEAAAERTALTGLLLGERVARERRLIEVEHVLGTGTAAAELLFERAQLLDALGSTPAARQAFLDVLATQPDHAGALNELGRLLDRTGFQSAARTAFRRAVMIHPRDPIGHGNLATSLLDAGDVENARRHYETALELDPGGIATNACLAIVLLRLGDAAGAKRHAAIGFANGPLAWPYRGAGIATPVLVVHSALGGNVSTDAYLDDQTFAKWTLVAEFSDTSTELPAHALVFNAIGDADRCSLGLAATESLLARTRAPVINRPLNVAQTGRCTNAARLTGLPGVVIPLVVRRSRSMLSTPAAGADLLAAGFDWPLIVRAPGFHTGQHCVLVHEESEMASALAQLPGDDVFIIAFIDVRRPDGFVRKYRVMIVGDALFPLHLAISADWKVHYFTADMANQSEHRLEEAAFLADMFGVLGTTAMTALAAIQKRLGLDYGGIDFALDGAGRVVVFEANATMIVPPAPAGDCWAYKHEPVARIHTAVQRMLLERARV